MLLAMEEVSRLQRLRVPVKGPEGRPRPAELSRVLADACVRLAAASGIEGLPILAADVVVQPGEPGGRLWFGSWSPARTATELDGGPKDGARVALQVLRPTLEYRQMAPGWQRAAQAGFPLPKVSFLYRLQGYDAARGIYVHRYEEKD